MGQSADQLRQEIAGKREDAAQKIDALQSQVEGAVHQVQDTVAQVKQGLDVRHQIEERPLLALGAALIAGFAFGAVTGGGGDGHDRRASRSDHARAHPGRPSGAVRGVLQRAVQEADLDDAVTNAASALLATVADKVKATVDEAVPGFANKIQPRAVATDDATSR